MDADIGAIEVEQAGDDVVVVRLLGEHDLSTADGLAEVLNALAEANDCVVVDVSDTEFADVAVFRALVRADDVLSARGRHLVLQLGTAKPVRRLFDVVGASTILACADDRAEAIELARGNHEDGGRVRE